MFNPLNPFKEDITFDDELETSEIKIHIRLQQRNGKKTVTTVAGLLVDHQKFSTTLKKLFHCRGSVKCDSDTNLYILEFSGDQRQNIKQYLIKEHISDDKNIIIHGY